MTTTHQPRIVTALTDEDRDQMHALYRHLHAHPELSMQEHHTAAFLEDHLDRLGIEHFRCGSTGVVGVMRNGDGPVVAFRADIDGLPIAEATGLPYASSARGTLPDGTNVPVMHGCGHDTHATTLLTAVKLLDRAREHWAGTLVLIFQPGEETAAGARAMLADGLWNRAPRPEVVFGQHVMPGPAGTVTLSHGTAMAMADALKITVYGRQSHGSQPHTSIDPIVLGAHMITRLQTIVSRELNPTAAAVVTIGTFHAGLKENIIPDTAEFTLNIRTFDDDVRHHVLNAVHRIITAESVASSAPEPRIEKLYDFPRCYNDPQAASALQDALARELGTDSVLEGPPLMGSEDFGHLAEAIGAPSVYWTFGGFSPDRRMLPTNHSPFFAPDEEPTLSTGTRAAVAAVLSRLGVHKQTAR
jgi:amidohydrolase